MSELALEICDVSKSYQVNANTSDSIKAVITRFLLPRESATKKFQAVRNINLRVDKGDAVGIIGKNGAGKSTLLRILSGIIQPDFGVINFYGKPVSILDIGAGFHPELTGRENIYLTASLYKFPPNEIRKRIHYIIDFSGIGDFIDEPVKTYSSGMYLRLAFSIITCLDADIYLIDEVINVGDANFQAKCKQRIEELAAAGKTMLIASHNLNDILSICNRIILMEGGEITDEGNIEIIQKYMTQTLPQYYAFAENESYHLKKPKDDIIHASGLKVFNYGLRGYEEVSGLISKQRSFKIFFEVENSGEIEFIVRLKIFDSTGVLVFVCSSLRHSMETKKTGKYLLEFEIPTHILSSRMYSADYSIVDLKSKTILFAEDKFLTFKIANSKSISEYQQRDGALGIINPEVEVTYSKI